MDNMCCIMIDRNHCHRFACSIMLQLGSRAPIVIKWPAVVLVFWPHFNGNAQRRPRSASLGLSPFSSQVCWFLCTSHGYPRGKSNRPRGCRKIFAQIWCFLVGCHWRFFGVLACLPDTKLEEQTDQKFVAGFDYKRVWPHRSGGEHSSQEQAEWSQQFDGKSPSGAGRSAHLGAKLIAYI